jgi:hypothetical protein
MRENQLHTVSLLSCVSADMNCRLMPWQQARNNKIIALHGPGGGNEASRVIPQPLW